MFALALFGGFGLVGVALSFVAIGIWRSVQILRADNRQVRRYRETAQLWDRR